MSARGQRKGAKMVGKKPTRWMPENDQRLLRLTEWAKEEMRPGYPVKSSGLKRILEPVRPLARQLICDGGDGESNDGHMLELLGALVESTSAESRDALEVEDARSLIDYGLMSLLEKAIDRRFGRFCLDTHKLDRTYIRSLEERRALYGYALAVLRVREREQINEATSYDTNFWDEVDKRLCDGTTTLGLNNSEKWMGLLEPLWPLTSSLGCQLEAGNLGGDNAIVLVGGSAYIRWRGRRHDLGPTGGFFPSEGIGKSTFFQGLADAIRRWVRRKYQLELALTDKEKQQIAACLTLSHIYYAVGIIPRQS